MSPQPDINGGARLVLVTLVLAVVEAPILAFTDDVSEDLRLPRNSIDTSPYL